MKRWLLIFLIILLLTPSAYAAEEERVRIAVIDTGISTAAVSPDSIGEGVNYIRPQDDTEDKLGHGTAISAIIVGSEAAQVSGICPTAMLIPMVCTSKNENGAQVRGDTAMVAQAIYDAIDSYGCQIINISSGSTGGSVRLKEAVEYAEQKGVLVLSCAGNGQETDPNAVYYPGGYDSVLCVGSANADGSIAAFSQRGSTVDLLALGTDLRLASIRGTRIRGAGTSFSTAIATGAAAQIWTQYPELTAGEVRQALLDSTRTVDGWPVLDLQAALAWVPQDSAVFSDVAEDAYYREAALWAAEKKITGGTGTGVFGPDIACTRAQIVTFLWRAAGSPEPKTAGGFSDVSVDAYYVKAVAWAVENGVTGGTGDGKFSPDATCSRSQAVTFLYRASGSPAVEGSSEFTDVAVGSYYADAVLWAAENGITSGTSDTTFSPANDCTRAQVITFLWRAMAG